VLALLGT